MIITILLMAFIAFYLFVSPALADPWKARSRRGKLSSLLCDSPRPILYLPIGILFGGLLVLYPRTDVVTTLIVIASFITLMCAWFMGGLLTALAVLGTGYLVFHTTNSRDLESVRHPLFILLCWVVGFVLNYLGSIFEEEGHFTKWHDHWSRWFE